jgi:hypothetical protein
MPTSKGAPALVCVFLLPLIAAAMAGCGKSAPEQGRLVPVAPPTSGAASAPTATTPGQNLLKPTGEKSSWEFWASNGGAGALTIDDGAVNVTVTKGTGGYWHVQFFQVVSTLEEGKTYMLSFRAKADQPMDMPLNAAQNEGEYQPIGFTGHAQLTREWKPFTFTFTAKGIAPGNNRVPTFMVGQKPVRVWVADVVLTPKT